MKATVKSCKKAESGVFLLKLIAEKTIELPSMNNSITIKTPYFISLDNSIDEGTIVDVPIELFEIDKLYYESEGETIQINRLILKNQ